jgi:hypothetical protein
VSAHRRVGQAERPADRCLGVPGRRCRSDRRITLPPSGPQPTGLQRTAFPLGQPAPDAVGDPVGDGVIQARLADRARRADLPRGPGRFAALGEEQVKVDTAARSQLPPARSKTRRGSQAAVPRRAGRHRAGVVTRARQAAAKAARSATSRPLAAKSSANRRGYRRVVLRAPWHTTVCGSGPGDRQPPDRLPGHSQPPGELRGGQEVRWLLLLGRVGGRGGGMSAAARARASASSSSVGTSGSVSWWVFTVLGCMVGSCVAGPCPLGDLGGWSRGPYLCPDLPGHIVTAMVRQYARARRAGRRGDVPPGVSRTRIPRLICGCGSPAVSGSRGPACPACRALPSDPASTRTPGPAPAKGGQLAGAPADAARPRCCPGSGRSRMWTPAKTASTLSR